MKNKWWLIFALLFLQQFAIAQELNCDVVVNAQKLSSSNTRTFEALEKSIINFMNTTSFSDKRYNAQQKVACYVNLQINSYENNMISGTLIVGSSRLVYGTTYQSPVLLFREENVSFPYIEYQPIEYSSNNYSSELAAILSFYAHIFIGLDQDTFQLNGGQENLNAANNILNLAQVQGGEAWQQGKTTTSRYYLINDLLSPNYSSYREALYVYHLKGMDILSTRPLEAKQQIFSAIKLLNKNYSIRPNNLLNRLFFDAKSNEIVQIYGAGPEYDKKDLIDVLNKINPSNSNKWYRM